MDNDGDLDVISSSIRNSIAWQENIDGLGNFGNIRIITDELDGITSISIADIDNDNDMDIISSSSIDGKIAWHENLGLGNFTSHLVGSGYSSANIVKCGDINGDGFLDIVANTINGRIAWFRNIDGMGNFANPSTIGSNLSEVTSIDVKDADGDGDNDVVVTSSLEDQFMKVVLYKNLSGQGSFGPLQVLLNEAPENNYSIFTRVLFQDIDNDGDNDILFSANNKLFTLLNAGSGTYTTFNTIHSGYIRDRIVDFYAKDMDDDGDLDIVAAIRIWHEPDKVIWFENDSTHSYTTSTVIQFSTYNGINSFKIDDINGDSSNDIVTGNGSYNYLVWYKDYTTIKILGKYCYSPYRLNAADFDNDGDLDFISAVDGDKLVWYENIDGEGTTGLQKVITYDDSIVQSFALGDIDGDGYIDIAVDLKWFKNDGDGNFTARTYPDDNPNVGSILFIEDVDNDGKNDLITLNLVQSQNTNLGWHRNLDGLGDFGPRQVIPTPNGYAINNIIFTDIDADGDKDIVFSGGKIGIIKNLDGAGTFATTAQIEHNHPCNAIFCVDMDGDGDLDILADDIVVSPIGSERGVGWFKNTDGLGNFSFSPQFVGDSYIIGAFPVDLDNDGDLDVVSRKRYGYDSYDTLWLENLTGLGIFGQPITLFVTAESNNTNKIVDVNNDGNLDILYSSATEKNEVSWFKNNGLSLNKITGTVRFDSNNNGCDTNDNPMSNVQIVTQSSNNETYSTFTSNNGYYQIYVSDPGEYITSVATALPNYFNYNPDLYNTNFVGINNVQALNFCITPNQTINDLEVTVYPTTEARPGFTSSYLVAYHNRGTTQLSGSARLQFDSSKMSYLSSLPEVSSQTSGELTFNFTNIQPFETKIVRVNFQIFTPPTVNLDDVISFTGIINPIDNDATPDNNIFNLNQTVIGSYDPNDINVLEGESIFIDEVNNYLHYVIRFQNTGTASAINVLVTNTLDDNLDWDSIRIDGISHNNYISIRNGNQISFVFNSIYLPYQAANELGSQGFICYKIKPKNNSEVGDFFRNNAQIYFDYNPAIHTNTVSTEIINPLSNPDFVNSRLSLYPNPTTGIIHLATNFEIKNLTIYTIYGQKVIVDHKNNEIDISDYSAGIYFIEVEDSSGKKITKKVLKK
jgi:uncharacterized repeat protein (TIGR01451 family)